MKKRLKGSAVIPLIALAASPAYALDAGQMASSFRDQLNSIGGMVMILAALLGLVIAIMGLMKFRAHSANPNDPANKLSSAFVLIFVGAAMIAVPALMGSGVATIFGGTGGTIDNSFVRIP